VFTVVTWPAAAKSTARRRISKLIYGNRNEMSNVINREMDMGWVHPWVGLGWVGFNNTVIDWV